MLHPLHLPIAMTGDFSGLAGRRYLITGATGMIGAEFAAALAEAGCELVLLGRKPKALEELADELEAAGAASVLLYPIDFEGATVDDYQELASRLEESVGALDGVLHCAARGQGLMPFAQLDTVRWAREMQVNLHAPAMLTRALWPLLSHPEEDRARVLWLLDDLDEVAGAYWGAYGVSKWALAGLIGQLSQEGERAGVDHLALDPGPVKSKIRGQFYGGEDPNEQAGPQRLRPALAWLLQDAPSTASGGLLSLR